jgi:hypothetical protein
METNQNESSPRHESKDLPFEAIFNAFRDQGRVWAQYGLTVGKLALETHAKAMSSLATSLGAVAESMSAKPGEGHAHREGDPR